MSCLGFNIRSIYYIYEFMGEEWSSCTLNSDDDETTQFRSEIGRITCFGKLLSHVPFSKIEISSDGKF